MKSPSVKNYPTRAPSENAYFNRESCRKELRWALEEDVPIIPIMDQCDDDIETIFRKAQDLTIREASGGEETLKLSHMPSLKNFKVMRLDHGAAWDLGVDKIREEADQAGGGAGCAAVGQGAKES